MSFKRSANPQTVPNAKVRQFDGIGGPQTQVLRRSNDKGWDISNTVANDVKDLHLSERGSAFLRPGMRRLGSEDYTIGWIGQMNIGGLLRYGIIYIQPRNGRYAYPFGVRALSLGLKMTHKAG